MRSTYLSAFEAGFPDLSDDRLAENGADWLVPHITGRTTLAAILALAGMEGIG